MFAITLKLYETFDNAWKDKRNGENRYQSVSNNFAQSCQKYMKIWNWIQYNEYYSVYPFFYLH